MVVDGEEDRVSEDRGESVSLMEARSALNASRDNQGGVIATAIKDAVAKGETFCWVDFAIHDRLLMLLKDSGYVAEVQWEFRSSISWGDA